MADTVVLYHASCADGFGAAFAAWKKYGDAAEYRAVNHGSRPPEDLAGKHVLIVDFSYRLWHLDALRDVAASLVVLDHHKTAVEDLRNFPGAVFDMNRSGATLTWWTLHETRPPLLLEYVEDRDLWRFLLPESREVSAALQSHPREFLVWDYFASAPERIDELRQEGRAILRYKNQIVREMAQHVRWRDIAGHRVPTVNATACFSEVGDLLCEMYPDAPFAAYYLDRSDGLRQWGARSRSGFDVSEVAKAFGGGGHPAAAGWQEPVPE